MVHLYYCRSFSFSHEYTIGARDYGSVETSLQFVPCNRKMCISISIVDDDVLESMESFTVSLGSDGLDNRISLSSVNATVQITDDDGMW